LGVWYWHFVDVMWLVVFSLCYVWCMGWFFSLKKMFLIRPYYLVWLWLFNHWTSFYNFEMFYIIIALISLFIYFYYRLNP
jgi:hypothetical protein